MINCWNCKLENREGEIYCGLCRHRLYRDQSGQHMSLPATNGEAYFNDSAILNGVTQVKVVRTEENGKLREIHTGVVIQKTNRFVRVFNPLAPNSSNPDAGGDLSPEVSQWFPIKSPRCWVEIIGNQERALPIPALFR